MADRPMPKIEGLTPDEQANIDRLAASFPTEREDMTMPVHCYKCGQPVTLVLTGWPQFLDHVTLKGSNPPGGFVQRWKCPHCEAENEGGFPGKMTLARKGHDAPSE